MTRHRYATRHLKSSFSLVVEPLPYPTPHPPSDTKILDILILQRLLLTLFYSIVVALRVIQTYFITKIVHSSIVQEIRADCPSKNGGAAPPFMKNGFALHPCTPANSPSGTC